MREHGKQAVLKDDEVDRVERASKATTGVSRQDVLESMYGRLEPKPTGVQTFNSFHYYVSRKLLLSAIHTAEASYTAGEVALVADRSEHERQQVCNAVA